MAGTNISIKNELHFWFEFFGNLNCNRSKWKKITKLKKLCVKCDALHRLFTSSKFNWMKPLLTWRFQHFQLENVPLILKKVLCFHIQTTSLLLQFWYWLTAESCFECFQPAITILRVHIDGTMHTMCHYLESRC